jgi:hypothetical protein
LPILKWIISDLQQLSNYFYKNVIFSLYTFGRMAYDMGFCQKICFVTSWKMSATYVWNGWWVGFDKFLCYLQINFLTLDFYYGEYFQVFVESQDGVGCLVGRI